MGRYISYGVATISRLLKILGLFCRISSLLQGSFAKETYHFKEPTNRSHPIPCDISEEIGLRIITTAKIPNEFDDIYRPISEINTEDPNMNYLVLMCCSVSPPPSEEIGLNMITEKSTLKIQISIISSVEGDRKWHNYMMEEIGLTIITTAKIPNKFSRQSPYTSNEFLGESPNFQTHFHVSKRRPRHPKDLTGNLLDLNIPIF